MENLWHDLRYGFRLIRRRPGFTAAAVFSLALGIGASTAIFSVVDGVLLRSLPYPEAGRLVQLREVSEKGSQMAVTEPNYFDVRSQNRSLASLAQYADGVESVTGGSQPVRAGVCAATSEFFQVLGVQPRLGRTFVQGETTSSTSPGAIVSYRFWQRSLGGIPDLTGAALTIADMSFSVAGVMPAGFEFPKGDEIWIPREVFPTDDSRTAHNWSVIARIRPGINLRQAREDMTGVGRRLLQQYGMETNAADFALVPLQQYLVGAVEEPLLILLVAVGILLLIGCANVVNLLLAQATVRQKELAVRSALGAGRLRLAKQFICESVILTLAGAILGVPISIWGVQALIAFNKADLPRSDEIGVDRGVLVFTLALSLMVAVVLGMVTSLRWTGKALEASLRETGRAMSASAAGSRLRGLLATSQVAMTLVLLVGAGLLIRSFIRLIQIDPGFKPESVVAMDVSVAVPPDRHSKAEKGSKEDAGHRESKDGPEDKQGRARLSQFYKQLIDRIGALPGVTASGAANRLPMTGFGANGKFLIDNNPGESGYGEYRVASERYFEAIGIPLLRGRAFGAADGPDAPHVAAISRSLAQKVWPDQDPIGRQIQFGNMDGDPRPLNIVGVVGDVHDYGLDSGALPTVYAYCFQRPLRSSFSIIARGSTDPATLASGMRTALASLDPEVPASIRTMDQIVSNSLDSRRFSLVLLAAFAAVALGLATTGIYGVVSYTVTQRSQEVGIRIALGAQSGDVLRLVIGQGMLPVLTGIATGLAASLALTRLMTGLLFGIEATDPATFALVASALFAVALVACLVPATRAARVDPMISLRAE
jgi:predicted permease